MYACIDSLFLYDHTDSFKRKRSIDTCIRTIVEMAKMIDKKNFVAVLALLMSMCCMITGFIYPLHARIAVSHDHFKTWLCMSSRDGGRGEIPYSSRGTGRLSSGGRGRGRGRASDQRENSIGSAESQKDIIYDSTNEVEVTRLFAPEDRFTLSSLTDGQKLRGRIVSVKE